MLELFLKGRSKRSRLLVSVWVRGTFWLADRKGFLPEGREDVAEREIQKGNFKTLTGSKLTLGERLQLAKERSQGVGRSSDAVAQRYPHEASTEYQVGGSEIRYEKVNRCPHRTVNDERRDDEQVSSQRYQENDGIKESFQVIFPPQRINRFFFEEIKLSEILFETIHFLLKVFISKWNIQMTHFEIFTESSTKI
ncbi:hypothetical protein NPIL_472731 [Nephila pilipes]|uniref:Uncharacterized protein n=1 Tax=Nephila pilipes TaxID=299642 RepID=A0A8X6P3G6_NEPPI|nr:hypothetical protein NPIL_472731 [Nephila pilipes]